MARIEMELVIRKTGVRHLNGQRFESTRFCSEDENDKLWKMNGAYSDKRLMTFEEMSVEYFKEEVAQAVAEQLLDECMGHEWYYDKQFEFEFWLGTAKVTTRLTNK